jgi:hypothetical protein
MTTALSVIRCPTLERSSTLKASFSGASASSTSARNWAEVPSPTLPRGLRLLHSSLHASISTRASMILEE